MQASLQALTMDKWTVSQLEGLLQATPREDESEALRLYLKVRRLSSEPLRCPKRCDWSHKSSSNAHAQADLKTIRWIRCFM